MQTGPRDPVRAKVASVWAGLLPAPPANEETNFFVAGGNSFLAAVLLESLNGYFGVRVTLRDFLADPSVGGVAVAIKKAAPTAEIS